MNQKYICGTNFYMDVEHWLTSNTERQAMFAINKINVSKDVLLKEYHQNLLTFSAACHDLCGCIGFGYFFQWFKLVYNKYGFCV